MMASKFRPSLLALSAMLILGSAAHAASLTPNSLGANAAANVGAATATPSGYGDATYINQNAYISVNGVGGGNGWGNAFSNQYGAYATRSGSEGVDTGGSSQASLGFAFTNTTGQARAYTLSFHIYGGFLSTNLFSGYSLDINESMLASYLATIKVNGSEVFSSGATLTRDETGTALVKSGSYDLGGVYDEGTGDYWWNGVDVTVNLGVLAAGQSFNIEALLGSNSYSNVGTYSYDDCGCGYYGCPTAALSEVAEEPSCTGFKGYAQASYGDPAFVEGGDENGSVRDEAPVFLLNDTPVGGTVPEPGAYGLAALALLAAGWNRRRKQR